MSWSLKSSLRTRLCSWTQLPPGTSLQGPIAAYRSRCVTPHMWCLAHTKINNSDVDADILIKSSKKISHGIHSPGMGCILCPPPGYNYPTLPTLSDEAPTIATARRQSQVWRSPIKLLLIEMHHIPWHRSEVMWRIFRVTPLAPSWLTCGFINISI